MNNRRDFGKALFGSAMAVAAVRGVSPSATKRPWAGGIQLSVQMPTDPSDEDLQFVN